jgi:alpha 1,2-mannosyltransferase
MAAATIDSAELEAIFAEQDAALNLPRPGMSGRGIVTSIYDGEFASGWVLLQELEHLECELPIEVWYRPGELSQRQINLLRDHELDVRMRVLEDDVRGFAIKVMAIYRSAFREVLWIDSDNVPIREPEFLFDDPEYRVKGSLFWRDVSGADRARYWHPGAPCWTLFRVPYNDSEEFETGQLLVDKDRCWSEFALTVHFNLRHDLYYRVVQGDKDTFRFAWQQVALRRGQGMRQVNYLEGPDTPYGFMPFGPFHIGEPNPWRKWGGGSVMQQRDREGRPLFNHRTINKFSVARRDGEVDDQGPDAAWLTYGPAETRRYLEHIAELRRRLNP